MPWPTQFKIMLELKRNQIIFQAIFLGMWPRKNTTPTTTANGLPKRLQRKIWYDMIWYGMIWYDMIYISEWAWGNSNATQQTRLSMMINWPMDEQAFKNNGRGFFFPILRCPSFNGYALASYHHWEARLLSCVAVSSHPFRNQDRGFFFISFSFFRFLRSSLFLLQEVTAALTSAGT